MIKRGVRLHPANAWAIAMPIIHEVYRDFGYTVVLTSGVDGKHKSGSLHSEGKAHDFRTHHVKREDLYALVGTIQDALGNEFDVLLENEGQPNEHLHVENDP